MNKIADTTSSDNSIKISIPILAIGTAFFAYRFFSTKKGSACKLIAGTVSTLGLIQIFKRLKSKP